MTISNIWKEREGEFDKKFKCIQGDCDGTGHIPEQIGEDEWTSHQCQFHAEYLFPIKSHNLQSLKLILQALVERLEGERKVPLEGIHPTDIQLNFGYNNAKTETIDYLTSELTKLE